MPAGLTFPIFPTGGTLTATDSPLLTRGFQLVSPGGPVEIRAPEAGGIAVTQDANGVTLDFHLQTSPRIADAPPVQCLRLELPQPVGDQDVEAARIVFDHHRDRGTPYVRMISRNPTTGALVEPRQFPIDIEGSGSQHLEFVDAYWRSAGRGDFAPMLSVERGEIVLTLNDLSRFQVGVLHRARDGGLFAIDPLEYFRRLRALRALFTSEHLNHPFGDDGVDRASEPLPIWHPRAGDEAPTDSAGSHDLFEFTTSLPQVRLTIPFRNSDAGPQVALVPPTVLLLRPAFAALASPTDDTSLAIDRAVVTSVSEAVWEWGTLSPDTDPDAAPEAIESSFRPARNPPGSPFQLSWRSVFLEVDAEQLLRRPYLVLRRGLQYVILHAAPDLIREVRESLGALGRAESTYRNGLRTPQSISGSSLQYREEDAVGLYLTLDRLMNLTPSGPNGAAWTTIKREVRAAVAVGAGTPWARMDARVAQYGQRVRTLVSVPATGIRAMLRHPALHRQLEGAPPAVRAEFLSDVVLFLGVSGEGQVVLQQLGLANLFVPSAPTPTDPAASLFSWDNFTSIWSASTEAREKLSEVMKYAMLAHARARLMEALRGTRRIERGRAARAARDALISDFQIRLDALGLQLRPVIGQSNAWEVVEREGGRSSPLLAGLGLVVSFVSLAHEYWTATSPLDFARVFVGTADVMRELLDLLTTIRNTGAGSVEPLTRVSTGATSSARGLHLQAGYALTVIASALNAVALYSEQDDLFSRGDDAAGAATRLAMIGELVVIAGGTATLSTALAPAGMALMAIGWLVSLAASTSVGFLERSPIQRVVAHSIFGTQAVRAEAPESPYHQMWGNLPQQVRWVMSALYPIEVHAFRVSGAPGSLSFTPTAAQYGSVVVVEFRTAHETISRFVFRLFTGTWPQPNYPAAIADRQAGHWEQRDERGETIFQVWTSVHDGRIRVQVALFPRFHTRLSEVEFALIYCTAQSQEQDWSFTWPHADTVYPAPSWLHEQPHLSFVALAEAQD